MYRYNREAGASLHIYHGDNVWDREHWELIFSNAVALTSTINESVIRLCQSFHAFDNVDGYLRKTMNVAYSTAPVDNTVA